MAFLQKERGLLKPGYKFRPLMPDSVLTNGTKLLTVKAPQEKGLQLTSGVASKQLPQTVQTR
jgi:hypothetical protein